MLYLCEAPEVTERVTRQPTCEERLTQARAIIDHVARICGCTANPAYAIHLLKSDEQARLYALLKGTGE